MSIEVTRRIWQHSRQQGTRLLLLLALGDHADASGICWPGEKTLTREIRLKSTRHTKRLIHELEAAREIVVDRRGGPHHCNRYFVIVGLDRLTIQRVLTDRFYFTSQAVAIVLKGVPETASPELPADGAPTMVTSPRERGGAQTTRTITNRHEPVFPGDAPKDPKIGPSHKNMIPPAVEVFRSVRRRYPPTETWPILAENIGTNETSLARWREVLTAWSACGWNPMNVAGALDYYRRGELPRTGARRQILRREPSSIPQRPIESADVIAERVKMIEQRKRDAALEHVETGGQ